MTKVAPSKVTLTCKVTGKQVTWLNRYLIQKAIDKHGSLEALQANFVSREGKSGNKTPEVKTKIIEPILKQGVKLISTITDLALKEYARNGIAYQERTFQYGDGTTCTVSAPKPPVPVFVNTNDTSGAGAKAVAAIATK